MPRLRAPPRPPRCRPAAVVPAWAAPAVVGAPPREPAQAVVPALVVGALRSRARAPASAAGTAVVVVERAWVVAARPVAEQDSAASRHRSRSRATTTARRDTSWWA